MSRFRSFGAVALATVVSLALAACSTGSTTTSTTTQSGDTPSYSTVTPDVLTISTGEPAYTPWVENDDPASGEGYEAALAYEVANRLGYSRDQVAWTRTTFDAAITPGAKDWDFSLQQYSISEERSQAVDFSTSYFTSTQALVAVNGTPAASATSKADLADLLIGVQAATTSYELAEDLTLNRDPMIYNNSTDVVNALATGSVDAIIVDLVTAANIVNTGQVANSTVVGQFPASDREDNFGIVLPKGSALTEPVSAAVDAIIADGTLNELQQRWLYSNLDISTIPTFS